MIVISEELVSSGLDPELVNPTQGVDNMGSYPLPRKFTVGLSVNF